jgi:hypothetical protein
MHANEAQSGGPGNGGTRKTNIWRVFGWGTAAGLLLLPAVAMRFTSEVNWTLSDFVFAAAMFGAVGGLFELAAKSRNSMAYRAGVAVALAAGFLLVWINLAVGVLGTEHDDANLMFAGVLGVAALGAVAARFRPAGMARGMIAAAVAQLAVGVIALAAGLDSKGPIMPFTCAFCAMWLAAAWLFHRASRGAAMA